MKVVNEIAKLTSRTLEKIIAIIWWLVFFKVWFCFKNYFNRNEISMLSHQLHNLPGYICIVFYLKTESLEKILKRHFFLQPMIFTFYYKVHEKYQLFLFNSVCLLFPDVWNNIEKAKQQISSTTLKGDISMFHLWRVNSKVITIKSRKTIIP